MVKPKWYSGGSRGGNPTRRLIVRVEGPKKIFGVSPTPPPPPSQGLDDRFPPLLACSRLRDSGEKSFSKKKCEKRAGAGERQGHFFPFFSPQPPPFSSRARLIFALLVLIRPHYAIWEPGTGYSLIWSFWYATVMWKLSAIRFLWFACTQK